MVLALWDEEEDGLVGSRYYADHPLVPLASTVGYVNFDIQGANLSPSLRNTSFAVASESGGDRFEQIVHSAINASTLDTETLSSIFGQNRSDYVSFLAKQVPSVFFTDATGPCYHTSDDEIGIVDFSKLDQQIAIALRVTRELANTGSPPTFAPNTPLVSYSDAVVLQRVMEQLWRDRDRFSARGSGHAEHDQGGSDSDRAGRPVRLRKRRRRAPSSGTPPRWSSRSSRRAPATASLPRPTNRRPARWSASHFRPARRNQVASYLLAC